MNSDDLRPNTRSGDTWTVLLLTLCNLIVPLVAYIWGVVRLSQTDRWNKIQKLGLLLILPVMFLGPALILATGTRSSSKVERVEVSLIPPATQATERTVSTVSVTTFADDTGGEYLGAVVKGVRFEQRNGFFYVGTDQVVWFFGTTVRPLPGTAEFEIHDAAGRKLAETGTTVNWGGGQVSASEAKTTNFTDKLTTTSDCGARRDSYWLVGKIVSPRFDGDNTETSS